MRFGVGDKVGESGKKISTLGFAGAFEQLLELIVQCIYGVETEAKIVVHGFSGGDGRVRGYRNRSRRRY